MSSRPPSPTPTRFACSTFIRPARSRSKASRRKLSPAASPGQGSGASRTLPSFSDAVASVAALAQPGDMVLTLGAGSVSQLGAMILEKLAANSSRKSLGRDAPERDGPSPVSRKNPTAGRPSCARLGRGRAPSPRLASEPTWHCLNSRKPVIVILLSGFLSTTDSKEWRGNQVLPRYRKSCIRFPTQFLSTRLPSASLSTTHGSSIWKRSRNPHFCAGKSASPSAADRSTKRLPIG